MRPRVDPVSELIKCSIAVISARAEYDGALRLLGSTNPTRPLGKVEEKALLEGLNARETERSYLLQEEFEAVRRGVLNDSEATRLIQFLMDEGMALRVASAALARAVCSGAVSIPMRDMSEIPVEEAPPTPRPKR